MLEKHEIEIARIHVPVKRVRTLDAGKVDDLANDILENGQTTPIRVRADGERFVLIEGFHRLEALRALGEAHVVAYLAHARLH